MSGQMQLLDWSARAAGLENREQWESWLAGGGKALEDPAYKPPCAAVPARLRRRLTRLTRLVLDPFMEVCERNNMPPEEVAVVLASDGGEIRILEGLFAEISKGEQVSPIDFCNSVHHTATGYLSISTGNKGISRTVSAGKDTFAAGLLETLGLISSGRATHVALLVADEVVPEIFGATGGVDISHGVALLFGGTDGPDGLDVTQVSGWLGRDGGVLGFLKGQVAR